MKKITYLIFIAGLFSFKTFSQNVAIELTKMNVFYISVDNPIKVVAQNYPCEKLIIKSKYGTVKPSLDSCFYIYRTDSCKVFKEYVYVGVNMGNMTKWLDTIEYRLKRIPDPVAYIAGRKGGLVNSKLLLSANHIYALMENIDIDLNFKVLKYSVEIMRNDSIIYKENDITGNNFSTGLISEIKNSKSGDKYHFSNIIIETNNSCSKEISGLLLTIE